MILSVINQKGGVGKTTTAINLAVSLAQWGHTTLLVDLDPQGNASSGVGLQQQPSPTLYEALVAQAEFETYGSEAEIESREDFLAGENSTRQTNPQVPDALDNAAVPAPSGVPEKNTDGKNGPQSVLEVEGSSAPQGLANPHPAVRPGQSRGPYTGPIPALSEGPVPNLWVVGASPELAGSEMDLAGNPLRDGLRQILENLDHEFSFIVIDTPPSVSLLTVNSLVAADQLIIPVQCEYFALEGLGQLLRTLEKIKRYLNPQLKVMGLLRTMYDPRVSLSSLVSQELEQHFPQLLFKTIIPRNVRLAEAPSYGKPIALHDRKSPGADAYRRLAREVLERTGKAPTRN